MSITVNGPLNSAKYAALLESQMPKLQMLPAIAVQALELVKQPECSVSEFSSIVERDAILASSMLKMANSPIYTPRGTISNLQQAVVRLGFQECKNLIMSSCVSTLTKKLDFQEEWIRDLLWRHSLYTAAIAHHLNQTFRCGYCGEEFTAGLLHDLGRLLLASLSMDEFLSADALDFTESDETCANEIELLEISHAQFAEMYGQLNNLPGELIAVMRWHHNPEQSEEHQKLVALIALADHMANHLQRKGDGEDYEPELNPFWEFFQSVSGITELSEYKQHARFVIEKAAHDVHTANAL